MEQDTTSERAQPRRYTEPGARCIGADADNVDLALLLLRVVAAGAVIFMTIVRVPGTPLLPAVPAAGPVIAVVCACVLLGVFPRAAALAASVGMLAIMVAGRAGGQRFIFEPTRDLVFAEVFLVLALGGSGQVALRPPVPSAAEKRRGGFAIALLRIAAGLSLIVIEGLSKAIPALHAWAAHMPFGYTKFIGQLGLPMPALTVTLVILNETLWPLLVMLGVFARPLAAVIVLHMLIAYTVSARFGQEDAVTALLYAAVYGAIAIAGPGRYALLRDRWSATGHLPRVASSSN